jgi:hypothetical protein
LKTSSAAVRAGHPTAKVWCALKLGDTKAQTVAAMGVANGHKADNFKMFLGRGQTEMEWDSGNTIYLATLGSDDKVENLQAYDGKVGPVGAKGLPCEPFRNAGG